jgi:hypothetical protein
MYAKMDGTYDKLGSNGRLKIKLGGKPEWNPGLGYEDDIKAK